MATGNLRKRGKNWYFDISTGRVIDGKNERSRRRANGISRAEAQAELNAELHRLGRLASGAALDNEYSISELRDEWLASIKLQVRSEKVYDDYRVKVTRLSVWLAGRGITVVRDITPRIFEEWQNHALASFSARIVRLEHQLFSRVIKLGVERGLISDDPLRTVKPVAKKRVKFRRDLRPNEVVALLENSTAAFRDIWFFLLCTGCRDEEMVQLQRPAVDLAKKMIYVRPNDDWTPKTEASIRAIPMCDELLATMARVLSSHKHRAIFCTQDGGLRTNNVLTRFKTSMRAALYSLRGIPTKKKLSAVEKERFAKDLVEIDEDMSRLDVHSLRYTFITELISSGVNPKAVQKLVLCQL